MEDELLRVAEFFVVEGHKHRPSRVRVSDRKMSPKRQKSSLDIKIRMVMKLENCTCAEAQRIFAARTEELRAKEEEAYSH